MKVNFRTSLTVSSEIMRWKSVPQANMAFTSVVTYVTNALHSFERLDRPANSLLLV